MTCDRCGSGDAAKVFTVWIDWIALCRACIAALRDLVRVECPYCLGAGQVLGSRTESYPDHDPSCDGTCRNCPVENQVEVEDWIPCEHCGQTFHLSITRLK